MNDIKGKIYGETGLCYPRITVTEGIEKEFKVRVAKVEQEIFQTQVYTTITTETGLVTGTTGNYKVSSKTRNQRKIGGCFSCFSSSN